jgi:aminoglycoside/choline kinase family phosphotransferase
MQLDRERWLRRSVSTIWGEGAGIGEVIELRGDASTRRFWRVALTGTSTEGGSGPQSAIVIDLGPEDLPRYVRALSLFLEKPSEPPWVNVHRFLTQIGVGVPALYAVSIEDRLILVEDLGRVTLFSAALGAAAAAPALFARAIEELALIHVEGTRNRTSQCVAFSIAYERRLFLWEMNEFVEYGLANLNWKGPIEPVRDELAELSDDLGALPRVFSHRDYHGGNLFVRGNRTRVIDFQDALMAPAAQDLAVLLTTRDTAKVISPELESELIGYYLNCVRQRGGETPKRSEFAFSYYRSVLQHALKMIGRFIWLDTSKPGYIDFVPDCIAQVRRVLAANNDFPILRAVFGRE